ncbi:thioesterase family protein [Geodermatophilus sp. URMC 64]
MRDTLVAGLTNELTHTITAEMSTGHTGTPVLSTPSMIGLMEGVCLEAAQPHLDEKEVTVGTHVCVSHVAASQLGEEVTVWCELSEKNRRRLTFKVRATVGDRLLGEGTHERAVIDTSRFAS